jgi:hypothetical protein
MNTWSLSTIFLFCDKLVQQFLLAHLLRFLGAEQRTELTKPINKKKSPQSRVVKNSFLAQIKQIAEHVNRQVIPEHLHESLLPLLCLEQLVCLY